jgi:K+-sensing histidine kinase KdpD
MGAISLAEKAAERNVKVRILMPAANRVIDDAKPNLKLKPNLEYLHKIELRHIEQMSDTKATILVIDRNESLVMELKDDSKTNLLSNAIKFTKEGSIYVTMDRSKSTNEVLVNVQDTGGGIDPNILPRLFTKFAAKSDKGTGLELFISKSII